MVLIQPPSLYIQQVSYIMAITYYNYKECACFACTLLGRLLHAGCYNLEIVVQWISAFKIPAVAHANAC